MLRVDWYTEWYLKIIIVNNLVYTAKHNVLTKKIFLLFLVHTSDHEANMIAELSEYSH